jgi:acetylornithine deacetylase/succinyl-diaminopimelate desuccinylase-like protein
MNQMDPRHTARLIETAWQASVLPTLIQYIRIPNKSPAFDPDWRLHGHMEEAVQLLAQWCREQPIPGMTLEVVRIAGRTPLLFIDIPGNTDQCVLLYGHLDKQPEMRGWRAGLGPWTPVLEEDRLYGRGGADDGYAVFTALLAVRAVQEQDLPHARCIVIIEACEESGSYDLPHYMEVLGERLEDPSLVICLDSGCGNYEQLWCTTSLRGMSAGILSVAVLTEGVHSGDAGGIVPSPFSIVRALLDRIEDPYTGELLPNALHVQIPEERTQQAQQASTVLGERVFRRFPFLTDVQPLSSDPVALILNRTWRPALAVTGATGLPSLADAGNVALPEISLKLSLRVPPTCDAPQATGLLKALLEDAPPQGAKVRFEPEAAANGWNAPPLAPWLAESLHRASHDYFGAEAVFMGEGGTIPFMHMLGERFPRAQYLITGVLGPGSNAHGPNEFLHIPSVQKVTCCIAQVISDHARAAHP